MILKGTVLCGAVFWAWGAPEHVGELYELLALRASPTLGVLSDGNFDSVHHLLPSTTRGVIFESTASLEAAVEAGAVDAGLISGIPQNANGLLGTFSSTLVSPRAMFSCGEEECDTLVEALDASIVRALDQGADVEAARNNPPFEYVSVHTCRTSEWSRFPYADATQGDRLDQARQRGTIRLASLGKYDWGNAGNYTASPPTGFWPDFERAIEIELERHLGVSFERVWAPTSDATMDLVRDGLADATPPYWTIDAFYENRARQHTFAPTCTTLGYDSTFLVRIDPSSSSSNRKSASSRSIALASAATAAIMGAFLVATLGYVRQRELNNDPLFQPLQLQHEPSMLECS